MKFDDLIILFIFVIHSKVELFFRMFPLPINYETKELSTVFHIYLRMKTLHPFLDRVHERKKTVR